MIKKTITYEDYDGNTRTQDFWFNLSQREIARMEVSTPGGFEAMVKRINASGIPALMSYTAGTYVCNSIMYNVLYLLDRRFPGVKGGFIHVPYATAQGVGKPSGTPTMEIATMAKAIEAAIEAAVSVDEDATDIMGETH